MPVLSLVNQRLHGASSRAASAPILRMLATSRGASRGWPVRCGSSAAVREWWATRLAMAAAWLGVRVRVQPAAGSSSPAVHRASRPLGHDLRDPIPVMTAWDRQPQRPPTPSPPPTPPDQSAPPRPTTARSHHRRSAPTKTDPTLAPKIRNLPSRRGVANLWLAHLAVFLRRSWLDPPESSQPERTHGRTAATNLCSGRDDPALVAGGLVG
jgi:hypothetical protein